MKYINNTDYEHTQTAKVGVLITNLGTPEAPTAKALKPYLKEFLSDPRVVEFPRALWWCVLNGIILNIRPRRSAKAYATVWTDKGSPLAFHTQSQHDEIKHVLAEKYGSDVVVEYAMRYGQPSIDKTLQGMFDQGVEKLLVLPLYPQYSASTTASTFDALSADFQRRRLIPELRFIRDYYDNPNYIEALAKSVEAHWQQHGRADKLIMSYHGIPLRYLTNGDPYHCQCLKTSRLLAERLGLNDDEYIHCFQSRFGREPWLQPYTDATLKQIAKEGVKSVQVVCPGFSADCLETIEEIGEENREYFLEAGGQRYEYIPCLNSQPDHIHALTQLIDENLKGWLPVTGDRSQARARFTQCPHNR